jgi:hypothetical protein
MLFNFYNFIICKKCEFLFPGSLRKFHIVVQSLFPFNKIK